MKILATIAIALAALLTITDSAAQRMPGRDRGDSSRARPDRDAARPAVGAPAPEPFSALERELPSLKVDLQLTAEQVEPWAIFERDVRLAAEIDRARVKQSLALRDASREVPGARELLALFADQDRRKMEATTELREHLESLYARLDDKQKRMLDRRVALSQQEPLGR
jgi:hypothetical protein